MTYLLLYVILKQGAKTPASIIFVFFNIFNILRNA